MLHLLPKGNREWHPVPIGESLLAANAAESWTGPQQAAHAFDLLFSTLGMKTLDHERLVFYHRLDPLTWG